MLDNGSNTSLLSKRAAKLLGLSGPRTQLTMNLAGGQQRGEVSEVLEIVIESPVDEDIQKNLQVHTVRKPCSSAKTVSRKSVEAYPHRKTIADKLHLSGGTVDLLIGTDFVDAFVDIYRNSGNPGEPMAKRNCFGWYILGQQDSDAEAIPRVHSVDIRTVSAAEDKETRLSRFLRSQTDGTLYLQWKRSAREQVCKSFLSLEHVGERKSASQNSLEGNRASETK